MVFLGGGLFLMSEVPLYGQISGWESRGRAEIAATALSVFASAFCVENSLKNCSTGPVSGATTLQARRFFCLAVQGYLAYLSVNSISCTSHESACSWDPTPKAVLGCGQFLVSEVPLYHVPTG